MRASELANRYARAVLDLAIQSGEQDRLLGELRDLLALFQKDDSIKEFIRSPVIQAEARTRVFEAALKNVGLSPITHAFVLLLASKNRLSMFNEIVDAVNLQSDLVNGVTRGVVRSATVLAPEQRSRIAEIVSRYTQKQVILSYKEDPEIIGGLIAEVGSHTFDDTLASHLRRIQEEMTRRV
jgi:F-type H+-transporting ATPase subunit delta